MRKWILGFVLLLVIALSVAMSTHQGDMPIDEIQYEKVYAPVERIDVRSGHAGKYVRTHYYDVYIDYNGETYKYSASTDPHLVKGYYYDFYICNNIAYRTVQEMQRSYSIGQEPRLFSIAATFVMLAMVGLFVSIMLAVRKKRMKN